jgi:hypothetical protein
MFLIGNPHWCAIDEIADLRLRPESAKMIMRDIAARIFKLD